MTSQRLDDLSYLLEFNADDLAQNRAGQLSESQTERLKDKRKTSLMIGLGINLVLAIIAAILIFLGLQSSPILAIIGIGLTIVDASIMGIYARYWMRITSDINERAILTHEGKLERVIKPINKRIVTYILRVENGEMVVSKDIFKAFSHQKKYRVYRARYTGTLLSAEEV